MPDSGMRATPRDSLLPVLYEPPPIPIEVLQDAIGDLEVCIYEAWEFDNTLTKDAARRFVTIAEIFGWDMEWVQEMREWAGPR